MSQNSESSISPFQFLASSPVDPMISPIPWREGVRGVGNKKWKFSCLALFLCLSTVLHVGLLVLAGSMGVFSMQNSQRPPRLQLTMVRPLDIYAAFAVSLKKVSRPSSVPSRSRWGVAHVEDPVWAETTASGVGSANSEAHSSPVTNSPGPWNGFSPANAVVPTSTSGNSEEIRPVIPSGKKTSSDFSFFSSAEGKSQAKGGEQSVGLNPWSFSVTAGGSGSEGSALGSGRGSHGTPDGDGNDLDGGGEFVPLKVVGLKKPAYPEESRFGKRGEEGTVILAVAVGADGKRGKIRIVKSSGFSRLDQTAIAALESATFVPATRRGKPVPMEKKIAFTFRLEDEQ